MLFLNYHYFLYEAFCILKNVKLKWHPKAENINVQMCLTLLCVHVV